MKLSEMDNTNTYNYILIHSCISHSISNSIWNSMFDYVNYFIS